MFDDKTSLSQQYPLIINDFGSLNYGHHDSSKFAKKLHFDIELVKGLIPTPDNKFT